MKKKLFLATFTLNSSQYMCDGSTNEDFSRLVWAVDSADAERILSERKEFKTDVYAVYRHIHNFEATEAIGEE